MKRILCFIIVALMGMPILFAQTPNYEGIIYVTPNGAGTNSGDSWANATASIADAQALAQAHNAVVWVAAGIYYGDTTATAENAFTMVSGVNVYGGFAGNEPANYDLTLRDFETNETILDGDSVRRVLYLSGGNSDDNTVLDGFTIRNGKINGNGGGVYMDANTILKNCFIHNNTAFASYDDSDVEFRFGGGVYTSGWGETAKAKIIHCRIINNSSMGTYSSYGGGVFANWADIESSEVAYNVAIRSRGECYGGGVYAMYSTIRNSIISNNTASNSLIGYNTATGEGNGSGVYASNTIVSNSIIVKNCGGGFYGDYGENVIVNSIVWGNQSGRMSNNIGGIVSCSYSAVEDGSHGEHNVLLSAAIQQSPMFVNPSLTAGASDTTSNVDWHLLQNSPCINRGSNSFVTDTFDLDGSPRIKNDTVDLGCYESDYNGVALVEPSFQDVVYVTPSGAGTQTGENWENATSSISLATALALTYNVPQIWVATGIYYGDTTTFSENAFIMMEGVDVYGGFAGNEPANYDLTLRDFETNETILDGDFTRRVLYQPFVFHTETVWDGFSIQNGWVNGDGGGIYMSGNATVRNCVVRNNAAASLTGASRSGGGIHAFGSSFAKPKIIHCQVSYNQIMINSSVNLYSVEGGGIYACLAEIKNSEISFNSLPSNGVSHSNGGGVYDYYGSSIYSCLIANNSAGNGGGIYVNGSNTTIENSTVVRNSSEQGNASVYASGTTVLTNSIIWGNESNGLPNNLAGSVNCSYSAIEGGFEGEGNINISGRSAIFVHPSETAGSEDTTENVNWHLLPDAVCINNGSNSSIENSTDLSGMPRIICNAVDMGCYEHYSTLIEFFDTVCDTFQWYDSLLTESGSYILTDPNYGCDTLFKVNLTIGPIHRDTSATACGNFVWHGYENLTESGDYADTLVSVAGCDSVITLHLTIFPTATDSIEVTIRERDLPYQYVNGEIDTTFEIGTPQLSTFNFQLLTQYGCDSTVTLILTIMHDTTGITTYNDGISALYPNPTNGTVTLQLTPETCPMNPEIQIFDIYGRQLQVISVTDERTQIDLSSYAHGVYLIKLVSDGRVIGVRKVVRN